MFSSDGHATIFSVKDRIDKKLIRKAIEKNLFFDQLESDDLNFFIDAFEHIEVPKGVNVVTQGDRGDFFYILGKNSSVEFELNGTIVGEASEGSFGELALMYSAPRAATVIAKSSPTNLFRVARKTFKTLLRQQTKKKVSEKRVLLEGVDFLGEMNELDLNRLARAMTLNVFQRDDIIVRKGDAGDAFYIVNEGQLKVTDISVGSKTFDDVTLKSGDYFGERALATNEPRAANVIAATEGSAFRIDRKTFEKVLGKFSRVIMKAQDRKIMEGIEVFESSKLTNKQFEELANLVVDKKFPAGEKILRDGRHTNAALYLVREGTVRLSGGRSDVIKPGAYFAEDLLLLDTKQEKGTGKRAPTKTRPDYSAIAEEDCLVGILSLSDCRTIFDTTKMMRPNYELGLEVVPEDCSQAKDGKKERSTSFRDTGISTNQWLKSVSVNGLRHAVADNVKFEDLRKHDTLGEGQFGEVFLVSAYISPEYGKQLFALKRQKRMDALRGDSVEAIRHEIEVLSYMDHPFIVNLVHYYEYPHEIDILMGAVYGGELFEIIHSKNDDGTWSSGLPENDARFYAMVIADTLDYIHRKQFVYRDLKPENVLIDKEGYPVICDFGFAKFVADKTYTLCGTPNYLSPEIIMNRGHDESTDHWALGVLIYEMVAGENPFYYDGITQMQLFNAICREKFYPLPDTASDEAFYVVHGLLEKDPNSRLGSLAGRGKDIMTKEWFDGLVLDDLRQKNYIAPYEPENRMMDRLLKGGATDSDSDETYETETDFSSVRSGYKTSDYFDSGYFSSVISKNASDQ